MKRWLTSADLLLIVACVIWGTNFVVVKAALGEFDPLAFNGIRFALAAGVLFWLQCRSEGVAVLRPVIGRLVFIGVVGNLCYQLLFIYGLDRTQAAQAGLFSSTTPLWVLVLAKLTGHDKLSGRIVGGFVLAAAGVAMLLSESLNGQGGGQGFWVGNLMLLGAALSWAVYTVYSQPLLLKLRPLALTSATMLAGAVPLLVIAVPEIAAIEVREVSAASWGGLLYSALMALVFGYLAWSRGVQAIGSARTSLYVNLIPVVAAATAWAWLGERLSGRQLIGAAAVILGIALTRRRGSADDQ